jgi:serine/threonine protein kinase/Leucine-rich repeat (LRR) protein
MAIAAVAELVDALRDSRVLDAAQLREVAGTPASFPEAKALARELIRRGWLTPYQANQLLLGRGRDLLLGSYVLMERLGEGGMGLVFKARNWKVGWVVALKVIRKERLTSPNVVRRFQREILAAAHLNHPNIVRAYDADEVGGRHFFAMEYVEGTDLARLVKEHGPLVVPLACDYVRQAALGLQHAHERGLVHRDIKPANLLLTRKGVVKLLDMGLARLAGRVEGGDSRSTLTKEGIVVGTLDYIAPEQSLDAHGADIRADLYSLGCTLFFLLTGRVPFPARNPTEKLLRHQLEPPPRVDQLRPEVPPGVAAVVARLMAKRPADRYRTPADLAVALADVAGGGVLPSGTTLTTPCAGPAAPQAAGDTSENWSSLPATTPSGVAEAAPASPPAARRRRRWLWPGVVVGALLGLAVLSLVAVRKLTAPVAGPRSAVTNGGSRQDADAAAFDQWARGVAALPATNQLEAVLTRLRQRNPGFSGLVSPTIEDGVVTGLDFVSTGVKDFTPLRALKGLKRLSVAGSGAKGELSDLTPFKGMPLTYLNCNSTQVGDRAPLEGMPLTVLLCAGTPVADLSPLRRMNLTTLDCSSTRVSDLSPVKGMPLTSLSCSSTTVADLTPLAGMKSLQSLLCVSTQVADLSPVASLPLSTLDCHGSPVADLSPLQGMPLQNLVCDCNPWRGDAEPLRGIRTLSAINGRPVAAFWEDVDARQAAFRAWLETQPPGMQAWAKRVAALPPERQVEEVARKLRERNPAFDGKLSPGVAYGLVTGVTLGTEDVTDLGPLRGMPALRDLSCTAAAAGKGKLADLSPLKGLPLVTLDCSWTQVSDLSPLQGTPLQTLNCTGTKVVDLAPLSGAPLVQVSGDFDPARSAQALRAIKTLQTINGTPAVEFLKGIGSPPGR